MSSNYQYEMPRLAYKGLIKHILNSAYGTGNITFEDENNFLKYCELTMAYRPYEDYYMMFPPHDIRIIPADPILEVVMNGRDLVRESWYPYTIEKLIFNGPATIVFWDDGTKTVVKLKEGSKKSSDDRRIALMWAMAKKFIGSRSQLEKRLKYARANKAKNDNGTVYTILMTIFDDPKNLEAYISEALEHAIVK